MTQPREPSTQGLLGSLAPIFIAAGYSVACDGQSLRVERPQDDSSDALEELGAALDLLVGRAFGKVLSGTELGVIGAKVMSFRLRERREGEAPVAGSGRDEEWGRQRLRLMIRRLAAQVPSKGAPEAIDFKLAAGDTPCKDCGLEYIEHPDAPEAKWLHLLCDGRRVKL